MTVTCLTGDDRDLDARIDRTEAIYDRFALPTIFRLSPLASPALDAALDQRGWRRFDETIVMASDMADLRMPCTGRADRDVEIKTRPDRVWLQSCYRMDGDDGTALCTLDAMLERLIPEAGYGQIGTGDHLDALALVVVDAELVGLFEVLTSPARRRQGLAETLLTRLFAWSRTKGASTAWLAVVADNEPARRFYQKLGFREVYRYHYWANR